MTTDPKNINELAKQVDDMVVIIGKASSIEDPVERFRYLESLDPSDFRFTWALAEAKAETVREIKDRPDGKRPTLREISHVLGVSPQRVHQLMNPEGRPNGRRDTGAE